MKTIILLLLILIILISGCNNQINSASNDSLPSCCQECLEYANQDPSGYDISIKPCSEYGLDCKVSVGECSG